MKIWLFMLAVATSSVGFAANKQIPIGKKDCQIMHDGYAKNVTVDWSGPCKLSFADGEGKLEWRLSGKLIATYEGGMQRGVYHGVGYYARLDDNSQYEGHYVGGDREGFGIAVDTLGDRYDGNWKAGQKHGRGKMVYALGGSYDGEWQNDVFHGKGTIVYAGGRRADYEFVNGHWPDAPNAEADAKLPNHKLKSNDTILGSRVKAHIASGSYVPFDLAYAKMSPAQKRLVASVYPLMDPADEPPYPVKGTASVMRTLANHAYRADTNDPLQLLVKVGADGKPLSVTAIGTPGDEIRKIATYAVMLDTYKPALCAGKPCEMIFPYLFTFATQ